MQEVAAASVTLPPLGLARANRAAEMRRTPDATQEAAFLAEWQQVLAVA